MDQVTTEQDKTQQDNSKENSELLTVTVGDLISAIVDAAEEATIGQEHIADLTSVVFQDMMRRRK